MILFVTFICLATAAIVWNWKRRSDQLDDISSKSVFITGCDSGFGRLLAIKCLSQGMTVFAGCLTEKGEDELKKSADNLLGTLRTIPLNITSDESVDGAAKIVSSHLNGKGLWGLVNNAGRAGPMGGDDFYKVEDYQACLDVNALGAVRVTQALKPLIKKSRGRIVSVSSVFGRHPGIGSGPYAMSKYALEAYCDCIRLELKPFGVSVHILEPGGFKTSFMTPEIPLRGLNKVWDRASAETREEYGQEYRDTLAANTLKFEKVASERLDYVVDAYFHALTAKHPKDRYWVGWDSQLFFAPLSIMPTFLADRLLQMTFDHVGYPKPRATIF